MDAQRKSTPLLAANDQKRWLMESYLENPIRFRSDHSALIQLAIGLVSLDLPVLVVTLISEYLVWLNEEKLFGEYSEQKSWNIAALIKKKAQIKIY